MSTSPVLLTADLVRSAVRSAAAAVAATERAALDDEPDGVHQHRTRVRRLRSVLAGLRRHLDAPAAQRLRVAYGEWGAQLGIVRDIEVRADVAADALRARGVGEDAGVWRRLVDDERAAYTTAHARLVELAAQPRASERARLLEALGADPVVVDGDSDAREAMTAVLRHEVRRVRAARRGIDGSVAAYHALRKAGRRLRYVAEAIGEAAPGLFGDELGDLAEAGERVHGALGDHRDALLFADRVATARALAARAGEPVRIYDELIDDARGAAREHLDGLGPAWKRMRHAASRLG